MQDLTKFAAPELSGCLAKAAPTTEAEPLDAALVAVADRLEVLVAALRAEQTNDAKLMQLGRVADCCNFAIADYFDRTHAENDSLPNW